MAFGPVIHYHVEPLLSGCNDLGISQLDPLPFSAGAFQRSLTIDQHTPSFVTHRALFTFTVTAADCFTRECLFRELQAFCIEATRLKPHG